VKRAINPYLGRVASSVGEKDPRRAIRALVCSQRTPGESLDAMALKLGISRIIEQKLPFDGGLFRLPDGELVIKLNSESSYFRKRFTLAHEIGHLLLKTVPAFRGSHHGDENLERTCDSIAAELLMPSDEIADFVCRLGRPSSGNLKRIASEYAVSVHAAALRLHYDLRLWKCAIGMWSLVPSAKTLWFVGPRRWNIVPDSGLLGRAAKAGGAVIATDLWRSGEDTERVLFDLLSIGYERIVGLVFFVSSFGGNIIGHERTP